MTFKTITTSLGDVPEGETIYSLHESNVQAYLTDASPTSPVLDTKPITDGTTVVALATFIIHS